MAISSEKRAERPEVPTADQGGGGDQLLSDLGGAFGAAGGSPKLQVLHLRSIKRRTLPDEGESGERLSRD